LVAIIVDPTAPVYSFQTGPATDEDIPLDQCRDSGFVQS
jgi:hypothetical protein